MKEVVIVSGARTAVGSFGGSLNGVKTVDLGALVIKEAIKRAGLRPAISDFVKSSRPDVFGEFDMTDINMYSPWQCDGSVPDYKIEIKKSNHGYILTSPISTEICSFERLLIYHLENALTLISQQILSSHSQIHASCVDFNGRGVLISGSHGAGKTTLALTALSSGLKALTDDITIVSKDLKTVKGFPRPFKVNDFTWNMHPGIVPDDCPFYKLNNDTTYVFFYIPPGRYYTDTTLLKHIIFPIRREGYTKIREMGETEALRKLLAEGMNFYLKEDGYVNDVIKLLRTAPPFEVAFSDHWDALRKIRSLLK